MKEGSNVFMIDALISVAKSCGLQRRFTRRPVVLPTHS